MKFIYNSIRFIVTIILLIYAMNISAQNNATQILDKAADTFEQANGISAEFSLHVRGDVQQVSESFEGIIQMKADKFTLKTPDAYVWYDGKTQWTYMTRNEEVNVTEPTGEELQYTNPVLLLSMYKKGYTATYKGESTAANGKTAYDIELTPKKKGDIVKVSLQIEKSSSLPARVVIDAKNGTYTMIQINKVTTALNQPDSFFVFDKESYPDADIIDLR